ncbi:bifunctional DNA-formamidopyrimidine glycosylase/DNA-(apurinic or apyrimidinic site) lyase [Actinomadura viridis]|uniref:Formamidopyrimidine-DNA glycosylase n=1 Tax=Actinomadura viridis TaxID=58110 RepID=A0A931DAZ6_9ACTN|nr:Fpg/Nei family DNA glycosylase [Actinomadura viridis]MBG6087749.1 formamidopyrimidine-DNA glycosylase [Actinomadura viridis]
MPELPEVEVVRRGLGRWVSGRTVAAAEVLHPRAVRRHTGGPADFAGRLAGRTMAAPERRGKYMWIPLDSGDALLAHLGMSGQLLVGEPDREAERHLRVRVTFTGHAAPPEPPVPSEPARPPGPPGPSGPSGEGGGDGFDLRFVDQRTFGHLLIADLVPGVAGTPVPEPVAHIAADPLEDAFDDEAFYRAVRRRRTGVKRALLDQSLISGVGNIYADEALWRAALHWARPTETLTRAEVTRVLAGVREVMLAALAVGGTSFDSLYVNVNGESGYFDRSLDAYGRRDEPCRRCGTPIRRDVFMNRSSYSCPKCQPRPRRARY